MDFDLYFDPDGQPISQARWMTEFQRDRTVALTQLPRGQVVSTIYLGLDMGIGWPPGKVPPLIYETMVMTGPYEGTINRYPTRAAAVAGHWAIVRQVKRNTKPLIHRGGRWRG